jgi:hypothetical protein
MVVDSPAAATTVCANFVTPWQRSKAPGCPASTSGRLTAMTL